MLISSSEVLDERLDMRDESLGLGLAASIDDLYLVVAQHEDEDGGKTGGVDADAQAEVDRRMATIRQQLTLYTSELASDKKNMKNPLDEYSSACVLLTTTMAVSRRVKEECKLLETLLDGLGVGYTVVDGAHPKRARVRNAFWAVSGKAIGSSVSKKDYPQVFVPGEGGEGFVYVGGMDEIQEVRVASRGVRCMRAACGGARWRARGVGEE